MATLGLIVGILAHVLPAMGVITADCNSIAYREASDPSHQFGYNVCNATTENQSSLCQTSFINALDDFCIWGPASPTTQAPLNDNQQEQVVAFCTKPGHGARVIQTGVFYTVTYVTTPSYLEVYGLFDATYHLTPLNYLNNVLNDVQLDPRGSDGQGNPIGGLLYSNAFSSSNGQNVQAVEWFSLMGNDIFYLRACDPNVPNSSQYCQRWNNTNLDWNRAVFQTMGGFSWNNTYQNCQGDSRPLGLVVDGTGATITYTGQALPTSVAFPTPSTSSCTTINHASLFQTIPSSITPGAQVCTPSPVSTTATTSSHAGNTTGGSGSSSGARIGAIVGSIIGVLLLIGALVAFFILRKRRRRDPNNRHSDYSMVPKATVEPFNPSPLPMTVTPMTVNTTTTPYSIPPTSSSAGLTTTTGRMPEDHSAYSAYASLRGSATSPTTTSLFDLPPGYADLPLGASAIRESTIPETDDEVGRWAAENRSLIPFELEQKLRAASYLPWYNPDEIPADVWENRHGIGYFELKKLRDLYAKRPEVVASQNPKRVYGSGPGTPGTPTWRPS